METPETDKLQQAEQQAGSIAERIKNNSRLIVALSIFIFVVLVGIMVWFFVAQNGSRKADEAVAKADMEQNDSIAMTLYKEAAEHGYKSGNRAKVEMGIRLYQQGKYQEALDYLKDADMDDNIVASGVYTLTGDCYVNLKNYDDALSAYKKAVSAADENPTIVPTVLLKEANVYREQKNYAAEAEAYKTILDEYPAYTRGTQIDIRKYYERAKASAK